MNSYLKITKPLLRLFVITPVIWFGTFGDNQICSNFIIAFNFVVGFLFCCYLFAKNYIIEAVEKELLKENKNNIIAENELFLMFCWLIPAAILIADGWIFSGILWVSTWALSSVVNREFQKLEKELNDQQDNDTRIE
jgi:uncharacterized membrane protein YciS (DUF1049 family)